jgi:hypothetical protein
MPSIAREFPLDPDILGEGSAVSIAVDAPASPALVAAIAANRPFPDGPIELGRINVAASTGSGLAFKTGGTAVTFKSSAEVAAGIGVFESATDALTSLQLSASNGVDSSLPSSNGRATRWAVMRWGYDVAASASGSHPIGVLGAVSFGATTSRAGVYAVLHRFDTQDGARDVLARTSKSWRLPRHVDFDGVDVNLAPDTWLVAEVDGSLALKVGARLGYDISFMRESTLLGLTRDLGVRIDANLKATFGVTASGSYLLMIGRESADAASKTVRLRLHKQSKRGIDFALNLTVGVTGSVPLPDRFDDFVETVFGVHGPQVIKDLRVIEKWIDPESDLGENIARLSNKTALDLLSHAAGFDAEARFGEAKALVLDALNKWDALPSGIAATTWQFLSKATPAGEAERFKKFLESLASVDAETRSRALSEALENALADRPESQWLQAIADRGLLALAQNLDRVSALARTTLAVLNGDVVKRIHDFIGSSLDLVPIRQSVQDADFGKLNEWLVARLGDLINKKVAGLDDLKQIRQAVFAVDRKVREVYESGIKALNKRYTADFAATYQRTSTATALLDVSFDLSKPQGLALFRRVAADGDLNDVLAVETDGVALNNAALSHEMSRTTHVELRLPFFTSDVTHVTQSLANLSIEEHAGRVLVYEFSASDKVTTANRARSELSILGTLRASSRRGGAARIAASGTIAYEARQVAVNVRPVEFERRTRPFVDAYLSPLFREGEASLRSFYDAVEAPGGQSIGTGASLGDVAVSMQVTYPAAVLESWLVPRDEAAVRADSMRLSRSVQASLRRLLAQTHFENLDNLEFHENVAALLVWASMPVSTSIAADGRKVQFNTDREYFWDYASRDRRVVVAQDPHTAAPLGKALGDAEARLRAAGRSNADLFRPARAGQFVELALNSMGDQYLFSLLHAEALIVAGATAALRKIAAAVAAADTAPATAVKALAEFAGTLVDTFNGRLQFLYTPEAIRTLGPTMLADASAAIHAAGGPVVPNAMLSIYVLGRGHGFVLNEFLKGALPSRADVAAAQTLVSL